MSEQLGTFEVYCDAPDYAIVTACREVGFRSPEDFRWQRLRDLVAPSTIVSELVDFLRQLSGAPHREWMCTCGQPLPKIRRFVFTYMTGRTSAYYLTQCRRCRTMFWDHSRA